MNIIFKKRDITDAMHCYKKIFLLTIFSISFLFPQKIKKVFEKKSDIVIKDYNRLLHEKEVRLILKDLKDLLLIPGKEGKPIDNEAVYRCAHYWFREEQNCSTIVAVKNEGEKDIVLGFVSYAPTIVDKRGHLKLLGVRPEYNGQGIGTRLVESLCQRFLSQGAKIIWLQVLKTNLHAQKFYENNGFIYRGTDPENPEVSIEYEKNLVPVLFFIDPRLVYFLMILILFALLVSCCFFFLKKKKYKNEAATLIEKHLSFLELKHENKSIFSSQEMKVDIIFLKQIEENINKAVFPEEEKKKFLNRLEALMSKIDGGGSSV